MFNYENLCETKASIKRLYCQTNGYNLVVFTDGVKAVYIDETAFDEPLTLEVAKSADYGNFDGFETIEEMSANYADGSHLIDFDESDYEEAIEF